MYTLVHVCVCVCVCVCTLCVEKTERVSVCVCVHAHASMYTDFWHPAFFEFEDWPRRFRCFLCAVDQWRLLPHFFPSMQPFHCPFLLACCKVVSDTLWSTGITHSLLPLSAAFSLSFSVSLLQSCIRYSTSLNVTQVFPQSGDLFTFVGSISSILHLLCLSLLKFFLFLMHWLCLFSWINL